MAQWHRRMIRFMRQRFTGSVLRSSTLCATASRPFCFEGFNDSRRVSNRGRRGFITTATSTNLPNEMAFQRAAPSRAEDAKRLLHEEVFQLLSSATGTRAKGPSAQVLMDLRKRKPELVNRRHAQARHCVVVNMNRNLPMPLQHANLVTAGAPWVAASATSAVIYAATLRDSWRRQNARSTESRIHQRGA